MTNCEANCRRGKREFSKNPKSMRGLYEKLPIYKISFIRWCCSSLLDHPRYSYIWAHDVQALPASLLCKVSSAYIDLNFIFSSSISSHLSPAKSICLALLFVSLC